MAADKLPCRNELTAVTVSSEPEEGTAAQVTAKVVKWHELTAPSRPPRISYEIGGELEDSARSQGAITEKFSYPDLAIVILLGAQFNSIRKSPIVLLTIALALIGTVIGSQLTGAAFAGIALLDVVSLVGIVISNAIVLIDRIGIVI